MKKLLTLLSITPLAITSCGEESDGNFLTVYEFYKTSGVSSNYAEIYISMYGHFFSGNHNIDLNDSEGHVYSHKINGEFIHEDNIELSKGSIQFTGDKYLGSVRCDILYGYYYTLGALNLNSLGSYLYDKGVLNVHVGGTGSCSSALRVDLRAGEELKKTWSLSFTIGDEHYYYSK